MASHDVVRQKKKRTVPSTVACGRAQNHLRKPNSKVSQNKPLRIVLPSDISLGLQDTMASSNLKFPPRTDAGNNADESDDMPTVRGPHDEPQQESLSRPQHASPAGDSDRPVGVTQYPGNQFQEMGSTSKSHPPPSAASQREGGVGARTTGSLHEPTNAGSAARPATERNNANIPVKSIVTQERENFLIFVKILFKILEEAREPETRARAQRIVLECRRRSQLGDPNFIPLMEATQQRLRLFVGDDKWQRAHLFLHHYKSKRLGAGANHPTALPAARPMGVH